MPPADVQSNGAVGVEPTSDREESGFSDVDATVLGVPDAITPSTYPEGLTSQELSQALRGQMLNHFLLEEFIGSGGMGVVFRALDTTLNRRVAVKVVASHRISSEDLQRRFIIEAQSTARLDHPNIARVHFVGRARGLPYIVFEYIEGQNLRELLLERGPLSVGEALGYAYQIANALAHAWQRNVVHRDIKPSNILITPQGQAKLVDMGLARLQHMDSVDAELTAAGVALGTFDYVSPEQARNAREADARSDIYSLGCTLFYMLAGQPPFAGGTIVEKVLRHQTELPPDVNDFRSDVPAPVHALLGQMLAKNADDRHATPLDLVAELAGLMVDIGIELPHALAPFPQTSPAPRVPLWKSVAVWALPAAAIIAIIPLIDRWYQGSAEPRALQLPAWQAARRLTPPVAKALTDWRDSASSNPNANAVKTAPQPMPSADSIHGYLGLAAPSAEIVVSSPNWADPWRTWLPADPIAASSMRMLIDDEPIQPSWDPRHLLTTGARSLDLSSSGPFSRESTSLASPTKRLDLSTPASEAPTTRSPTTSPSAPSTTPTPTLTPKPDAPSASVPPRVLEGVQPSVPSTSPRSAPNTKFKPILPGPPEPPLLLRGE